MYGRTRFMLFAGLAIAAAVEIGVEQHRITTLQHDNATLALAQANDSAALDTTRRVSVTNQQLAHALGDSLAMSERLVVQVTQRGDSIDRALKLERRGRYAMAVAVDSLARTVASRGPVTEDSSSGSAVTDRVRRASFDVRQAPYTVAAAVELPAPPDTAHLDLRIALDPIPVVARLSCAPPNAEGIRSASIEASAPAWASIRFDHVEQSPDLCASPALTKATGHRWYRPAIVAGFGKVTTGDGRFAWGGFIGGGLAVPIGG